MNSIDNTFQEFVDANQMADDANAFERIAARLAQKLGFQRFAYLRLTGEAPMLISSYPKSWTSRYFQLAYQQLDPVVLHARLERGLFSWGGGASCATVCSRAQRHFFDEASTFGIRSGITVPIRGGFGQMAAFTLAAGDRKSDVDRFAKEWRDILYQAGLYFHVYAAARLGAAFGTRHQRGKTVDVARVLGRGVIVATLRRRRRIGHRHGL